MVFSSLLFLCLFLPLTVGIYFLLPKKFRNLFLLLASLLFYAWGEPRYILLMAATAGVDYAAGILLSKLRGAPKKAVLWVTVVLNLGSLCFFKYTGFLFGEANALLGEAVLPALRLALPVGISFYTFQTLSYVIDVYRGNVAVQKNFIDFFMYVTLFPQLIAGPIVRYSDVEADLHTRVESIDGFAAGAVRFCVGLGKKVLLANSMGRLHDDAIALSSPTVVGAWLAAVAFTFQIYFDFSGYSDMAIGMGQMFGFRFPENFRYPYEAVSVTDFWRRWHITLSAWFREYVYIPLGGNRRGMARTVLNLFIVWALTGIWHGAGWNFILWGLYYFLLLLLEKTVGKKLLKRLPRPLGHLWALLAILFGWVLFSCDDLALLGRSLSSMFGIGAAFVSGESLYLLKTALLLLLICAVGSTHLPKKCYDAIAARTGEKSAFAVAAVGSGLLLGLSLLYLTGDSYNPFLYFRF